jgi:hypothetical protein
MFSKSALGVKSKLSTQTRGYHRLELKIPIRFSKNPMIPKFRLSTAQQILTSLVLKMRLKVYDPSRNYSKKTAKANFKNREEDD